MSPHRLFVAVDLPEETRKEVGRLREPLPGARWVPTDQLHLTLRFIGEVSDATLAAVREGLAAVEGSQFSLAVREVGHFPPRRPPRAPSPRRATSRPTSTTRCWPRMRPGPRWSGCASCRGR